MSFSPRHSEGGSIHLAIVFLVAVIVVGAGVAVFVKANKSTDDSQKDMSQSAANSSSGTSLQINQRNAARKNDASKTLSAVTEYVNNNNGQLPTMYANGRVTGGGSTNAVAVSFEMFTSVGFASGQQLPMTTPSELRLVTQAACGENGEAVAGSSRGYVVQFVLEKTSGGYTSDCKEG